MSYIERRLKILCWRVLFANQNAIFRLLKSSFWRRFNLNEKDGVSQQIFIFHLNSVWCITKGYFHIWAISWLVWTGWREYVYPWIYIFCIPVCPSGYVCCPDNIETVPQSHITPYSIPLPSVHWMHVYGISLACFAMRLLVNHPKMNNW